MVWIDRSGNRIAGVGIPADHWIQASISPDGRRAILQKRLEDDNVDLWVFDLQRETLARLTFGGSVNQIGVWSPDGKDIIYSTRKRGAAKELHRLTVDVPASDRLFFRSKARLQSAFGWSPDGKWVLIEERAGPRGFDLLIAPAAGGAAKRYVSTPFNERRGEVSPDGRWALYNSNESGSLQAYVESFPTPGKRQQVSSIPIDYAFWCAQGREILIFSLSDFKIRSVPVTGGDELHFGPPKELFHIPRTAKWIALAPDGQRFLMLEPAELTMFKGAIAVNVNWMAGLKP